MSDFDEEEQFNDEEVIIDDQGEDDFDLPSDSEDSVPEIPVNNAQREKEQEEKLKKELTARFNPRSPAALRLISDLKEIMKSDSKQLGFSTTPVGNDLFNWEVHLFGFEKGTPMFNDMQQYKKNSGKDYVLMHVSFPEDYPNNPPFVRVVEPRFKFHTGRVTVGGSLCADILTMESWNPLYDIQSLMVNITSEILNGNPRLDFSNPSPYSLEEAKQAYLRVARDHNWRTSGWLPKK